jgi:hypothetical protein
VHKQEVLPDKRPVVKHLLMLGTPNNGVPCADWPKYKDAYAKHLGSAKDLMLDDIARFNQFVNQTKGTMFSALVGNGDSNLCMEPLKDNDGFTGVESARFGVSDVELVATPHEGLVDSKNFGTFMKPRLITGPQGTYPIREQNKQQQQAGN